MAEYEKLIPFTNWSTEDFNGLFGAAIPSPSSNANENHTGELILDKPYLFKAGGTYSVPQTQALHFAKQLAVRELHRLGTPQAEMLTDIDMAANIAKCFPSKPSESAIANSFERLDVKDTEALAAVEVTANKTVNDEQLESDDDVDTVEDIKNNAGTPKFKAPLGRPRKDAQYSK